MHGDRQPAVARGFTLLELLVVLAIAGLLILTVPPLIAAALPGTELKSAARELTVSLRKARFAAVSRGIPVAVLFSADKVRYSSGEHKDYRLPRDTVLRIASLSDSDQRQQPVPVTAAEPFRLSFYPDGSSSGARILLSREQQSYALSVGWLMGRVYIDEGDSSAD